MTIQAFFQSYLNVFSNCANFQGRLRRRKFWPFTIVNTAIYLLFEGLFRLSLTSGTTQKGLTPISWVIVVFFALYVLVSFLPAVGTTVRRLHDVGLSGWFILLNFIPYFGSMAIFVLLLQDSKRVANQWGFDPKEQGWRIPQTPI